MLLNGGGNVNGFSDRENVSNVVFKMLEMTAPFFSWITFS